MKSIDINEKSLAHTPQYKMHKYFARRPYNVFNSIIKHYTNEGDIIIDPFCGGGVTIFEALSLKRKVIGIDINPLATFITEMEILKINSDTLKNLLNDFINAEKTKYEKFYNIKYNGKDYRIIWSEYIYIVDCPNCNEKVILKQENKVKDGVYFCKNCKREFKRIEGKSDGYVVNRIKATNGLKTLMIKDVDNVSFNAVPDFENEILNKKIPQNWDRNLEDCLDKKGILKFSDFYTKRNEYINYMIFKDIIDMEMNTQFKDILYFLFSSSLRYTNNMSRVTENWENGNPTCMDKHAFWLPNEFIENNILDVLEKRSRAIINGLKYTNENIEFVKKVDNFEELKNNGNCMILNQSSSNVNIPDNSIDMVITDPPYGSNVQYAELSSIWNIWYSKYKNLDKYIYNDEEAVVNRKSGEKDIKFYENMLKKVFMEMNRILKKDGLMVFTFNNKNIKVWIAMLKAIVDSGFELNENGICFQDYIDSYKNTAHLKYDGNVQGDFIYTFKKSNSVNKNITNKNITILELLEGEISKISKLYSKINTNDLYKIIFLNITNSIIEYIKTNNEKVYDFAKKLPNSFIDNIIGRYYEFNDGMWNVKKENK